jgi:hypothetical protein
LTLELLPQDQADLLKIIKEQSSDYLGEDNFIIFEDQCGRSEKW